MPGVGMGAFLAALRATVLRVANGSSFRAAWLPVSTRIRLACPRGATAPWAAAAAWGVVLSVKACRGRRSPGTGRPPVEGLPLASTTQAAECLANPEWSLVHVVTVSLVAFNLRASRP